MSNFLQEMNLYQQILKNIWRINPEKEKLYGLEREKFLILIFKYLINLLICIYHQKREKRKNGNKEKMLKTGDLHKFLLWIFYKAN